jgi:hypothetical protein
LSGCQIRSKFVVIHARENQIGDKASYAAEEKIFERLVDTRTQQISHAAKTDFYEKFIANWPASRMNTCSKLPGKARE